MNETQVIEQFKSRIGAGAVEIYDGKVVAVDEGNYTVDVELDADLVLPDVKLRSVINTDEKAGFVCLPQKDTEIVFAKIEGESDYVLLKTAELEKVIIEIDTAKMEVSKDGYKISKGTVSLLDVFQDVKDLLMNLKVTTPSGPSTNLLPDSIAALNQLEIKFKDLLK